MNQPIKTQHFPRMKPSDRRTESCSRVKHSDLMTSLERLGSFEVIFESKKLAQKLTFFDLKVQITAGHMTLTRDRFG